MENMDYYLDHPEEWDKLSQQEQADVFMNTDDSLNPPAEVVAEAKPKEAKADEPKAKDEEPKAEEPKAKDEEPVITSKDGKHTIPYSRLEEAQQALRENKERLALLETTNAEQGQLIENLKAAAQKDAEQTEATGEESTTEYDKVLEEYDGEFPDVLKDLAPFFQKMFSGGGSAKVIDELKNEIAELKQSVAPIKQTIEQDQQAFIEQDQQNWHEAKDAFWSDEANKVFSNDVNPHLYKAFDGRVKEISMSKDIEQYRSPDGHMDYGKFLAAVKSEFVQMATALTGQPAKTGTKVNVDDVLKKAEEEEKIPSSLTHVPGTGAIVDENEAALHMGTQQATAKFMNMEPNQIEEYFGKVGL